MPVSEAHNAEIAAIKLHLESRRAAGVKGPYPADVRTRVVRLRRDGVAPSVLSQRLGIATSMLYGWEKRSKGAVSRGVPASASVMEVKPDAPSETGVGSDELRFQFGSFAVTIRMLLEA
jgi:hypothetical protein